MTLPWIPSPYISLKNFREANKIFFTHTFNGIVRDTEISLVSITIYGIIIDWSNLLLSWQYILIIIWNYY